MARLKPLAGLLLALNLTACSAAHKRDAKHTWFPATTGLWHRLDSSQGGPSSHDEYVVAFALLVAVPAAVDLVCLPFHGLGHLVGPKDDGSKPALKPKDDLPVPPVTLPDTD